MSVDPEARLAAVASALNTSAGRDFTQIVAQNVHLHAGGASAARQATEALIRSPGAPPLIWNVPFQRNAYFTGRNEILEAMRKGLSSGSTLALTQVIQGLGGVGKTQLALEYAHRYSAEYDGVWWVRAEQASTLAGDYAALAPQLGLAIERDQEATIRRVRSALAQQPRFLLIFDNATTPATIDHYLPQGAERHIIVTTQAQYWPGAERQPVDVLHEREAMEFIFRRTDQKDEVSAREIARRLGYLPLALEQAAAYVVMCKRSLHDYRALLEQHGLAAVEQCKPYQYDRSVATTWGMAFEELSERCREALDLLSLCAFLAPDAISLSELAMTADTLPEPLALALRDEIRRDRVVGALLDFSLVHVERGELSVHRLVQEVVRVGLDREAYDRWLGVALRTMAAAFSDDSDDPATWRSGALWLAHVLAVTGRHRATTVDPAVASRLCGRAGACLYARAEYMEAERLMLIALTIDEARFGPDHPNVAQWLNNLGSLSRATNRREDAELLFRRALEINEARFGRDHPSVATVLNNLAWQLNDTDRLEEAEPLMRRALAIDEASVGPNHPLVAHGLNNLASLLRETNRWEDAELLFRRALEINEARFGRDHPSVATVLNNLASLLHATNRLEEAERLMRRALAIDEVSLGAGHPDLAVDLNNLALLLKDTNRPEDAESLLRRAQHICEVSLGDEHPRTSACRKALAGLGRGGIIAR